MKLVALCGLHGAGKDTVADALPARKLAFADTLYREVAGVFGVTVAELKCRETKEVEQERFQLAAAGTAADGWVDFAPPGVMKTLVDRDAPRSPRQILQWWGDYRRAQDPDYFTRQTVRAIVRNEADAANSVITDCRFPNEAAIIRQLGGIIWQVVRHGHNPPCNGHASENDGSGFSPDVVIENNGTLDELRDKALQEWNK